MHMKALVLNKALPLDSKFVLLLQINLATHLNLYHWQSAFFFLRNFMEYLEYSTALGNKI